MGGLPEPPAGQGTPFMSLPGRNDPCPCGSGKKYKRCCQSRSAAPGTARTANPALAPLLQRAVQLHQVGQLSGAGALYRKILEVDPEHPDALHLLGVIAHQAGNNDEAIDLIQRALRHRPANALYHGNLGLTLQARGQLPEALAEYDRAIALQPAEPGFHNNKGNARRERGELREAIDCYRQALSLNPGYAEAYYNLGVALQEQGNAEAARDCYRQALTLRPAYPEALSNLGMVLEDLDETGEAEASFRAALRLRPEHAEAHAGLASLRIRQGRFEAAETEIARTLELKPEYPNAWSMRVRTRKMTSDDADWLNTANRLLSRTAPPLSRRERLSLQFAIGKFCDDTRQYDLAFAAYHEANRLQRELEGGFDRAAFTAQVDVLMAGYTAEVVRRRWEGASSSELPVLIVGMPRSGTTLLEQIIASHPRAFGAGELPFWGRRAKAHQSAVLAANHDSGFIAGSAADYLRDLGQAAGDAERVVDKMPGNFLWLGLIHAVFPQARLLHCRRHPVDTCLSIYFQNFNATHAYGTDLGDLAFYYREYRRLMDHWRQVLPADRFLEVNYEDLIEDPALRSRQVIEFIGLEWDERCLDFHQTERGVATASQWQVRQKIYKSSKARWRHYEQHLGPLRELLEL
jgi:tetratricopeptide (TPR) repeat protein